MKRDMDLIRELLLRLEAIKIREGQLVSILAGHGDLVIDGYDTDQIAYHLDLMRGASFFDESNHRAMNGSILFRGLTREGHDFLDAIRDPAIWAKTKGGALAAGGFTVGLLKDLAKGFVKKQIEEHTGISL